MAEDHIALAFHPEIGWAMPIDKAEALAHEVEKLKRLWFDDANPLETEYVEQYRIFCTKHGMKSRLRLSDFDDFPEDYPV